MAYKDLVFKSQKQAEKLQAVFIDRYGAKEGAIKYNEILARSPKLEDLPEVIEPIVRSPRSINISRKLGKRWRIA